LRVRGIEEPTPDEIPPPGYVAPPPDLVVGNEWRLIQPLRSGAASGSSLTILTSAVVAQVQHYPGVSGGLLPPSPASLGMAFADLAVTGRRAYMDFILRRPREGGPGGLIESAVMARLVAAGASGWTPALIGKATSEVLDRAYQVAWFLRAQTDRGGLGWIAVSGEDDLPHRPVNVPRTPFPQHDLSFTVPGDLGEVVVQTRFAIATADEPPAPPALPPPGRNLPPVLDEPTLGKTLGKDNRIILFINGSDSRLEEANDLIPKLVRLPDGRPSGYTVLTLDLPGSGYASQIDHAKEIGPWTPSITVSPPVPGFPTGVVVGDPGSVSISLLPFMERFIIRFVAALSTRLGRPRLVESRIAAVVGGSLGGNLALRLARRQAPWLRNVVAWDAGSVWRSLPRGATNLTNFWDPRHTEQKDIAELFAGISFAIPEAGTPETEGSRDGFFAEVFDRGIPPSSKTQPEQWYGDHFWAKSQYIANARLDRRETYTWQFRQWHWRISLEELMWSWRDPTVQDFKSRILLGAGAEDDIEPAHIFTNTAQLAVELANADGDTFFFNHTGHSIHAERPQALARTIMAFLEDSPPPVEPVPAIWDLLLLDEEVPRVVSRPVTTTWELLLS
jgi:pimeloyl-ACP methyl ester carboxylesterase